MSPKKDSGPSYNDIFEDILRQANGPVLLDDLVKEVLARHPTTSKRPRQMVVNNLRWLEGFHYVRPDEDHILPVRLAFQGARFRIRMTREMVDQAGIPFEEYFKFFFQRNIPHTALRFQDEQGRLISFQFKTVSRQVQDPLFGKSSYDEEMLVLKDWFHSQKMYHKDHLLVTVVDWEHGIFRLERESGSAVNQALLAERNQQFADILYDLLENSRTEDLVVHTAIPTVYARLPDKAGYPPDHWGNLIQQDQRMVSNGFDIHYSDSGFSMLEKMVRQAAGEPRFTPAKKPNKEQEEKIYRFRAEFKYRPGIWREIEIQGEQTLAQFDRILRGAFSHDSSDHLSGFWQLVERKGSKRKSYREVDLGNIEPFGGGDAAGTHISELDLKVNDRLKYVYDFGDWVEHVLTVQSIGEPEPKVKYPREVARNKPKHQYCVSCREKGKQTIAEWICLECSDEKGQEIFLCEECAGEHEEHYVEEILY